MKLTSLLEGLALGAGLMYVLDPENGRRRRAMARDQFQKQIRHKQDAFGVMQRDFVNRSRGMMTQIKAARTQGDIAADEIVGQRVRSAMGRFCSHPRAVHCEVHDGEVTLTGQILSHEVQKVVHAIRNTRGVHKVVNNLDVYEDASGISSLQGESNVQPPTLWKPATGLVMTAVGGVMTLYGFAKRGAIGSLVGAAGIGMVTKAFRDTENRFMPTNNHTSGNRGMSEETSQSFESYEGLNTTETDEISEQPLSMPSATDENSGMI